MRDLVVFVSWRLGSDQSPFPFSFFHGSTDVDGGMAGLHWPSATRGVRLACELLADVAALLCRPGVQLMTPARLTPSQVSRLQVAPSLRGHSATVVAG